MEKKLFFRAVLSIAAMVVLGTTQITQAFEINLISHIEAGMIEQDVFVDRRQPGTEIYRVTTADYERYLDLKLYASSLPVSHDPGNENATGPYIQGRELNMTLRDWLAAKGTGDYTCRQGKGQLEIAFENLVPNAVYTMWNFYVPTPAAEPFSTYDLPMGKRDGSESAFFTDASGRATYKASLEGCLQGTGEQLAAGMAIAWHSDGVMYGSHPGRMGQATHVQIFQLLPDSEELNNDRRRASRK